MILLGFGDKVLGISLAITLGCAASVQAQSVVCSDSFAVANVGTGKTWQFLDLDNSTEGSANVVDGKLTLAGRGADIYGAKNEFVAVYRSDIQGDFDVSVKLESQDSTHDWAQAGIVVANDFTDLTKGGYAAIDVSPGNGYTVFYDKTAPAGQLDGNSGAGKTRYPSWLRFAKSGKQYTAWYMTAASSAWSQLPLPPQSLNTGTNVQIGLFSVSHSPTKASKSVFDDFTCLHAPTSISFRRRGGLAFKSSSLPSSTLFNALGKGKEPSSILHSGHWLRRD